MQLAMTCATRGVEMMMLEAIRGCGLRGKQRRRSASVPRKVKARPLLDGPSDRTWR